MKDVYAHTDRVRTIAPVLNELREMGYRYELHCLVNSDFRIFKNIKGKKIFIPQDELTRFIHDLFYNGAIITVHTSSNGDVGYLTKSAFFQNVINKIMEWQAIKGPYTEIINTPYGVVHEERCPEGCAMEEDYYRQKYNSK